MKRGLLLIAFSLIILLSGCSKQKPEMVIESKLPGWIDGKPLYEVFVRNFSEDGTLDALTSRLDHFQKLGISNLWLMPVQEIGIEGRKGTFGSPYAIRDYYDISDDLGTMEDLKELVDGAHALGMRVILDVVFNHAANDNLEMKEHPDRFAHDEDGNFTREVADWSDITDWNYDNPETRAYLRDILIYYVRDIGLDGFRCDVAAMVPGDFWKMAIDTLQTIKPDVYLLAEAWEGDLLENGFSCLYAWDFYHRMYDHSQGKIDADSLWNVTVGWYETRQPGTQPLRFVENHDEMRSAEKFGWPAAKAYAAYTFTVPGIPLIYTGQEIGATDKIKLFEKEGVEWKRDGSEETMDFYKELIGIRSQYEALQKGSMERIDLPGIEGVLAFTRSFGTQTIRVLVNFTNQPMGIAIGPDFTLDLEPYGYSLTVLSN